MWLFILQRLSLEFLWHLVYFPIWWYSAGAVHAGRECFRFFEDANHTLAPFLWLRNLFVPMYGQTDWQGRIVSVFIRLVNVMVRATLLALWSVVIAMLFVLWLAAPIVIVIMLWR
jgi:hypothetical protein